MTHCHHCHHHEHGDTHSPGLLKYFAREIISCALLVAGISLTGLKVLPEGLPALIFYLAAVAPVAAVVIRDAWKLWRHLDFMNEFTLMLLASFGAFCIHEYPEAVAVLLFYCFGEKLEGRMSGNVRSRVRSLIDRLPDKTTVVEGDSRRVVSPREVPVGSMTAIKPGERIALDGTLKFPPEGTDFDTSAITGEAVPRHFSAGDRIEAGMIPLQSEVIILTTAPYSDSSLSRILKMIEEAADSKSPTETTLRRITRWYTPLVFGLAVMLVVAPWVVALCGGEPYSFTTWFRRSLVFLVCSCPCALVVGVPLSYFMAIGRASASGILFKGSRYIDTLREARRAFFDKTGTLTTGHFHVERIVPADGISESEILAAAASADARSSHPLATAVISEAESRGIEYTPSPDARTVPHGIEADNGRLIAGSRKLLGERGIGVKADPAEGATEICVARDGKYMGSVYLADTLKPDVPAALRAMHSLGINDICVLSGDREEAVARTAREAGADTWHAGLLPADKQKFILTEKMNDRSRGPVIFTGDGINDAPALAAADAGIAMGTAGTALAMESADIVIVGDDIARIPAAIRLAKRVHRTVIEVVSFALAVKLIVMALGAFGIATLWAAVFADTGVTLIVVLWTIFALRIPKLKSTES